MLRTRPKLRRDLALANANAAVWAFGNGMVSTLLVIYLALELGAPSSAIGLILAAPRFAGLLRLTTPTILSRVRRRKPLCIAMLAASALVLLAFPLVSGTARLPGGWSGVQTMVALWCLYHALEYIGVVLLWAWLADVMPAPVRGRLIGQRESYLVVGRVAGLAASFAFVTYWNELFPNAARWHAFAASAMIGAGFLLASTLPLVLMASRESRKAKKPRPVITATHDAFWQGMLSSLQSRAFRRLMAYSVGLSLANGVTATAQSLYPQRVLGFSYGTMLTLRSFMLAGQTLLAPLAGRWFDRFGAKRMLIAAQLVVATGPLFYFVATPQQRWWIAGAWIVWIAYAMTNVALDGLKIALAPTDPKMPSRTAALAVYYVGSDLSAGVMAIVGGVIYERLTEAGTDPTALYSTLFFCGWLTRTAVVAMAARLETPLPLSAACKRD